MPPKAGNKITKEEELLLEGFNKNVSTKSSALFYGNAFIVSVIPVWLYWRVHSIDIASYAIMFVLGTFVSTWLITYAYKNTKHQLKHKVAIKREAAVTKEVNKQLSDDKKISKKEKDERILWKKNEVAEYEATTFSIFFNNSMFLLIVILVSFYFLKGASPHVNYCLSMGLASGLIALLSSGNKN
uniref:Translocon-associated protein subunit gamma n=1 Tax=Pseudodiaptomus poplesia TaxID=213370 RepID=A0A0U2T5B7_9MAXI|nr:translocon-associated protein subunit gamma-like protein [Pseudodiaptomus poplesia]